MWSSLSFKHGIKSKFFPPLFINVSLPWIFISSRVSTQSDEKPGQITRMFFILSPGRLSNVLSVYGWSHFWGPNRDWKVVFIGIFLITILNLPSLEYRNTNIKNYSDNAVNKGVAESPSDRDVKAFPVNDFNFNNIIFAQNIFWNKIFKNKNKIIKIKNYSFEVKNVYPMTGLKRIMFITENRLDYVNEKLILDVNSSILIILKILYYFTFIFVFIIFLFSLNNCLKYNEKNKHNNSNI